MAGAEAAGRLVVVIDGPAGAGKSTVARGLAGRLGLDYLDTGAMYRGYTLAALRRQADLADPAALVRVVEGSAVELSWTGEGARVLLDGEDVSAAIRTREVTNAISHLADRGEVRAILVERQRELAAAAPRGVVAEGRDLGSVVFPAADVKFYLDASVAERARRRARDLGGEAPPLPALEAEIAARDARDRARAVGPLVRCPDAIAVDTSDLTQEQVLELLERRVRERAAPA